MSWFRIVPIFLLESWVESIHGKITCVMNWSGSISWKPLSSWVESIRKNAMSVNSIQMKLSCTHSSWEGGSQRLRGAVCLKIIVGDGDVILRLSLKDTSSGLRACWRSLSRRQLPTRAPPTATSEPTRAPPTATSEPTRTPPTATSDCGDRRLPS